MCLLVTAITLLVLHTGKLGKCVPVGDCYYSPCIASRQAEEVCTMQSMTAITLLVLHTGELGKCVSISDCFISHCIVYW